MATITEETRVQLSMGNLYAIGGVIVGAAALLGFVLSKDIGQVEKGVDQVRQETVATRHTVQILQSSDAETRVRLSNEIGRLGNQIATLNATMTGLDTRLGDFNKRIDTFQTQLTNWNDPKVLEQFVAALQKAGLDPQQKIVIVPLR
jgi:septal ring factor EnvC (AmiA/AmiB activator)